MSKPFMRFGDNSEKRVLKKRNFARTEVLLYPLCEATAGISREFGHTEVRHHGLQPGRGATPYIKQRSGSFQAFGGLIRHPLQRFGA